MTTKYKDLNEFERQILAGEITNFEPYFKNQNQTQLRILKQICIRHGVYQEAYTDWASNENDTWTQQILASNGYCLEILIHAKENYVREAVLKKRYSTCIGTRHYGKQSLCRSKHIDDYDGT